MRCLSPSTRYSIQLFEGQDEVLVDHNGFGRSRPIRKPVVAQFEHQGVTDWELEAALKKFTFSGLPEGVHPATRIGVFDTEVYCMRFPKDERSVMQAKIEERLRELQPSRPNNYIIVESPVAEKPWGSYDEETIEDVLKFQERLEIDPTRVRRYEQENKKRKEIVAAMEALEAERAAKTSEEAIVVEA